MCLHMPGRVVPDSQLRSWRQSAIIVDGQHMMLDGAPQRITRAYIAV